MPHYLEDRLLSSASVARIDSLLAPTFGPVIHRLGEINAKETIGAFLLNGNGSEGWDWALHRFVRTQGILRRSQKGTFTFQWTAQAGEDIPGYLLRHLLESLCMCCNHHPRFSEMFSAHSEAVAVFFPRIYSKWSDRSEGCLDPFRQGTELPIVGDKRFYELIADELALLIQKLLLLTSELTQTPPLIGIANLHWVDAISISVLLRVICFIQPRIAIICLHVDESHARSRAEEHRSVFVKLDRLVLSHKAQKLARHLWSEKQYPLYLRDQLIYCSRRPHIMDATSLTSHEELIGTIFSVLPCKYQWLLLELMGPTISSLCTSNPPPIALLDALTSGVDITQALAYTNRLLLHQRWKQCLQAEMQANRITHRRLMPSRRLLARARRTRQYIGTPTATMAIKRCLSFGFDTFERLGTRETTLHLYEATASRYPNDCPLLIRIGRLHRHSGSLDLAAHYFDLAFKAVAPPALAVAALCHRAVIDAIRANTTQAFVYLDQAKSLLDGIDAADIDLPLCVGRLVNAQSLALYREGRFDDAGELLRRSIQCLRHSAHVAAPNLIVIMYRNLGRIQQRTGCQLDAILATYLEALAVALSQTGIDGLKNQVGAHTLLAVTFLKMEQPRSASHHFEELVKLPSSSLRMSTPAICRYAIRLFRNRGYDSWAEAWKDRLRMFYLGMAVAAAGQ
jgi:tetratricopeptide (TPR) repeat protein